MKFTDQILRMGGILLFAALALAVIGCPQESNGNGDGSAVIVGIVVRTPPNTLAYAINVQTTLQTAGIVVHRVFSDDTSTLIPVAELSFSELNVNVAGDQEITVTWNETDTKIHETTFNVYVGTVPQALELISRPNRKFYTRGEAVDLTGMVVRATYPDEPPRDITEGLSASVNISMNTAGVKILTVRYMGIPIVFDNDRANVAAIVFGSPALRDLAIEIDASELGATASNPLDVKVPATILHGDIVFNNGQNAEGIDLIDNLGGLFVALGDKFVNLDLSDVLWEGRDDSGFVRAIPFVDDTSYAWRNAASRWRNRIVTLKLPPGIVYIGANAFRNAGALTRIDLSGLSSMVAIGESAFRGASIATEIDFTGCTALRQIGRWAFQSNQQLTYIDLAPATSLERLDDRVFEGSPRVRYVEFPESLRHMGDYMMQSMHNLQYVRFRGDAIRTHVGWSNFLYFAGNTGSPKPAVHRMYWFEEVGPATLHTYVLFHPNTLGYTTRGGAGWYWSMDARDNPVTHRVPLPYDPSTNSGYPPDVDALRGADLMNYQEQFRGVATVTINATGIPAQFNGSSVVTNVNGISGSIAGGNINLTLPTPTSGLRPLNPETAQELTGFFRDNSRFLHQFDDGVRRESGLGAYGPTAWTQAGRNGRFGIPAIWPDDLATAANFAYQAPAEGMFPRLTGNLGEYPQFLVLEMDVQSGGNSQGTLQQWGRSQYMDLVTDWLYVREEVKSVRWVYVDRDCTVYRTEDHRWYGSSMRYVWLNLKQGWNMVEASETFQWFTNEEANNNPGQPINASNAVQGLICLWISGGTMADNSNGQRHDIRSGPYSHNIIPFVPIPWEVRTDNPFQAIMTQEIESLPRVMTGIEQRPVDSALPAPDYRAPWRVSQR